jgi:hypothetical protein
MIRFLPPRRLSQPAAKAPVVKRETETAKRIKAGTSHRMADRRRGYRRGAR